MNVREIEAFFDVLYPKERSCKWDNDGLLVCPDREREVKRVFTCLDVTFHVIERAVAEKADLIVSHHPLIFSPLSRVTEDTVVGQKVLMLLEAGISLISLHTRLDGAVGGLNEHFARTLGIASEFGPPLLPDEPYIGGIGNIEARLSPEGFASNVSRALNAPVRLCSAGLDIHRVGYCCGGGKDLVEPALEMGADAFVGGDISYHVAQSAAERGMTVIDCGHHASEVFAADLLCDALKSLSDALEISPVKEALGGEIVDYTKLFC